MGQQTNINMDITITIAIAILFFSFAATAAALSADQRLIKLAVLHRHGDRVPEWSYANDPYPVTDVTHWPEGEGQLTLAGKRRMLAVGRFLRQRYQDFMSNQNPIVEVFARSSPLDRCLASAQLLLTGAYPPSNEGQVIEPQLKHWQPIPVHSESFATDRMLITPSKMNCDATQIAKKLQTESPQVLQYYESNRELLDKIERGSGETFSSLGQVHNIYDALNGDRENGKPMPQWVKDLDVDEEVLMQKLEVINDLISCINSSTKTIHRLDSGVFLWDLKNSFENPIIRDSVEKKAFFYSAHDSKLIPVMKSLDIFDNKNPPYGSAVLFELWEQRKGGDEGSKNRFVKVYYMKDDKDIQLMRSRGCPVDQEECEMDIFFNGISDYITDEETHDRECKVIPKQAEQMDCFSGTN